MLRKREPRRASRDLSASVYAGVALFALTWGCRSPRRSEPQEARPAPAPLPAPVKGQEATPSPVTTSALRASKGFVGTRAVAYLRERDQGKHDEQLLLEGELELAFDFGDGWTGFLRPRLRVDALDGELKRFEPFEAYATKSGEGWDLRLGQQIDLWGVCGVTNPINVINRRDFASDFLMPDRLGELGVRARVMAAGSDAFDDPTLSLYALPVWRRAELPTPDSRYSPETDTLGYDPQGGFEPSGFDRAFFALRAQATLRAGPLETATQAFVSRGPERFPQINVAPRATGPELQPVYYGTLNFGGGLRARARDAARGSLLGGLALNAEVLRRMPYDFDGSPREEPEESWTFVVGPTERFEGVWVAGDRLTATLEYAHEFGAGDSTSQIRIFRNDLAPRVAWSEDARGTTEVIVRGLVDLESDERVLEATFRRRMLSLSDKLVLILRTQVIQLDPDEPSLLNFFPNNSLVEIGLRFDI